MELLKLLVNSTLMLMTSPGKNFTAINFRPPDDVVPKHYRIQLKVDIENNIFHGISNVNIIIYKETDSIYLHAVQLNISQPTTIENENENKTTIHIVHNITYLPKWEAVVLSFDEKLSPGNYTLNMVFMGNISNNVDGFFKTSYINDEGDIEWFVATHNWATGLRRTFPCWDDPELKARFNIIVQHHRNYTVLSTVSRSMTGLYVTDDVVQTHFFETPEIPTYFIAIVLCKLPNINEFLGYVNLRSKQQFVHDLIFASYVIKDVTRYFQDKWKEVIVLPMPEHFAVPGLLDDGIATWGPVFYRAEDIIYDEKLDPIGRKMEIAFLIGREIGRRCLSSVRSPSWWSYFWLNEGIATVLFAWDIIDKMTVSNSRMSDLFVVRIVQESLYLDDQGIMNPLTSDYNIISDINSVFSFSYYIKAPAILRMLQHILSIRVFRNGIDMYLKRHIINRTLKVSYIEKPSALTDFLIAMQVAYDNGPTILSQEINVTEVMHPWIRQNHYPIVHVTRYIQNHFHIKIENASKTWWYPVTYTMPSRHISRPILHKSGMEMSIFGSTLEDDWIILNLHQTGYYRVNYDTEIWRKIACYLNSENYKNIPVLNRAQIIDDAFYFTITGQLNASIFWELTRYLWRETEYVAWYPMIKAIERISYIFPFPNINEFFKTIISLDQLEPLLGTIGYNEDPNDSDFIKCLRQEAVKWACVLNLPNCKKMAFNKLQWHLTSPTRNTLLPGWKKWTYCNGLKMAKANFKTYKNILDSALFLKYRKSLEFVTCSGEYYIPSITIKVENHTEYPFNVIEENINDNINFFHYNIAKNAKSNSVLNHTLANLEKIKPKEISMAAALIDIISHVYSKEQLDEVMEFVREINRELLIEFTTCSDLRQINSEFFTKTCEFILNDNAKRISDTKKKIDIRLSQIQNQINSFVSVFGISPGRKIENCNACPGRKIEDCNA